MESKKPSIGLVIASGLLLAVFTVSTIIIPDVSKQEANIFSAIKNLFTREKESLTMPEAKPTTGGENQGSFMYEIAEGNLIHVRFKTEDVASLGISPSIAKLPSSVKSIASKYNVISVARTLNPKNTDSSLARWYTFTFPNPDKAFSFYRELKKTNAVEFVERDMLGSYDFTPQDEFYLPNSGQSLWALEMINAQDLWDAIPNPGEGVTVAVIDSGYSNSGSLDNPLTHADLVGSEWVNEDEIPGNGIDDDGNGYIDDRFGASSSVNIGPFWEDHTGHGTHIGGTIAAQTNEIGLPGVAFESKIMPFKVGNGSSFPLTQALQGIVYAVDNGADIINTSWGGNYYQLTADTVEYAEENNKLIVASAGNDDGVDACLKTPAGSEYAVAVSALKADGIIPGYSNIGTKIDISAPGGLNLISNAYEPASIKVLSTLSHWPNLVVQELIEDSFGELYLAKSGTSMAAPHVAAAAAIIKQLRPNWNTEELRSGLRFITDSVNNPFHQGYGHGKLNLAKILELPETIPVADLYSPRNCESLAGDVPLVLSSYLSLGQINATRIEIASGASVTEDEFETIFETENEYMNEVGYVFDSTTLPDGFYALRVSAITDEFPNGEIHDRNAIAIDNTFITSPEDHEDFYGQQNQFISITGGVNPSASLYRLSYYFESIDIPNNTPATVIFEGTPADVSGDLLAEWNIESLASGMYKIILETFTEDMTFLGDDSVVVVIDNDLINASWPKEYQLEGYPVYSEAGQHKMLSPKIVDVTGDGFNEIVFGDEVYDKNGDPLPGWGLDARISPTTPAIADIDGDGDLEIFTKSHPNQQWNNQPAHIRSRNGDGSLNWSFEVVCWDEPACEDESVTRIPYTVVDDLNGDGNFEVIFVARADEFSYKLFILDALTGALVSETVLPEQNLIGFSYFYSVGDVIENGDGNLEIVLLFHDYEYSAAAPDTVSMYSIDAEQIGSFEVPSRSGAYPQLYKMDGDNLYDIVLGSSVYNGLGEKIDESEEFLNQFNFASFVTYSGNNNEELRIHRYIPYGLIRHYVGGIFLDVVTYLGDLLHSERFLGTEEVPEQGFLWNHQKSQIVGGIDSLSGITNLIVPAQVFYPSEDNYNGTASLRIVKALEGDSNLFLPKWNVNAYRYRIPTATPFLGQLDEDTALEIAYNGEYALYVWDTDLKLDIEETWNQFQANLQNTGRIEVETPVDIPEGLCEYDLNSDGLINVIDLGLLLTMFSLPANNAPEMDFNGDGFINTADVLMMIQYIGTSCIQVDVNDDGAGGGGFTSNGGIPHSLTDHEPTPIVSGGKKPTVNVEYALSLPKTISRINQTYNYFVSVENTGAEKITNLQIEKITPDNSNILKAFSNTYGVSIRDKVLLIPNLEPKQKVIMYSQMRLNDEECQIETNKSVQSFDLCQ